MWFFKKKSLPARPPRKNVAVRLEAIGGQGANSAGKILAEAAVLKCGFSGNHFSSFGSEKRGTPVRSFVRFSTEGKPIRSSSAIQNPDVLVIFHEILMRSHPEILEGAHEQTDLVINSKTSPREFQFPVGAKFRSVATVDATEIARQKNCGTNAVMLGALSSFCSEVPALSLQQSLDEFFERRGAKVAEANRKGFLAGQAQVTAEIFRENQASIPVTKSPLPQMGWMNAPIGGVITNPGNSVLKDHSASRKGVAPQFFKDICFNCGFCDMVCPDYCFVWEVDPQGKSTPTLKGLDYQYCKGCQKCIAVCPVEALKPVLETSIPENERQLRAYPEVNRAQIAERWQHLDWTAFVDRLSDQEKMGSLQTELLDPKTYLRPQFSDEILAQSKEKKP